MWNLPAFPLNNDFYRFETENALKVSCKDDI